MLLQLLDNLKYMYLMIMYFKIEKKNADINFIFDLIEILKSILELGMQYFM